jgi:hypothetical protein
VLAFTNLPSKGDSRVWRAYLSCVKPLAIAQMITVKYYNMKKGDTVHWNFGKGEAEGKVEKKHTDPVTKTIKGAKVKRNASEDKPAYEVKQESGNTVLKSESELKKGKK